MTATEVPDHEVAIIGAGIGGIGVAIALRRAGIEDVVILERAEDIGGTWRDNVYPGIGVDVPAQAYQFSYELKPDWSRVFAKGNEVKAYIDQCADHHDVRRLVRLGQDVAAREWDDDEHLWRLTVAPGGGTAAADHHEVTARFVVSAIGAFIDPKPTVIPGLESFTGPVLRSASWDDSVVLDDRRVAIVGTGASAVQIIPEIAERVGHLDVYQRTPIWVAPKVDPTTPWALKAVFRHVPMTQQLVRAVATRATEALLVNLVVEHDRVAPLTHAAGWLNRNLWYRSQVRDGATRRKLTPDYDVGCKRPAVSNRYLKTFNRSNVALVTDPIEAITPTGVRTADGTERPVDVMILATGFRLATDPENYRRRPVRGRDGFDLATFFTEERARSYESVSMPGLPNHFMIFGPYGWTGGTWHVLVETASAHILRVLEQARSVGATSVEVREDAADRWTAEMVARMDRSLWNVGSCTTSHSYYRDDHGDTPFLRPTSSEQAKRAARTFPLADYRFDTATEVDTPLTSAGAASRS